MQHRRAWTPIVLLGIVLLGTGLRLWKISSGLPESQIFVHDEIFETFRALQLLDGHYDFHRPFKGFYFYILAVIFGTYGLTQVATGRFGSLEEFVSYSIVHTGEVMLLSRLTSAILSVLTIYLLYRVGRRVLPRLPWSPALIFALTWATNGMSMRLAKWGFVETCVVFLAAAALLPILNLLEYGRRRDYFIAVLLIAAATSTKIYAGSLVFLLWFAHICRNDPTSRLTLVSRLVTPTLVSAGVAFIALWALFDPSLITFLLVKLGKLEAAVPLAPSDAPSVFHFEFYFTTLRWHVGNVMLPFVVWGLAAAFWHRKRDILILAGFTAIFVVVIGIKRELHLQYERYALLALPSLNLIGVYGITEVYQVGLRFVSMQGRGANWFLQSGKFAANLAPLAIAAVLAWDGIDSLRGLPVHTVESFTPVETEARDWFEQTIPPGSKVAIKGQRVWPGHQSIPLYDLSENYTRRYATAQKRMSTSRNMKALPHFEKAADLVRYNLLVMDRSEHWDSIDKYVQRGIEYFVIYPKEFREESPERRYFAAQKSRIRFYEEMKESDQYHLLKTFDGRTLQGFPKTIEVYGKKPATGSSQDTDS